MDGRRMAGEWQENGRRMAENGQRMAGGWPEGELEAEAVLEDSQRWFELFCIASGLVGGKPKCPLNAKLLVLCRGNSSRSVRAQMSQPRVLCRISSVCTGRPS